MKDGCAEETVFAAFHHRREHWWVKEQIWNSAKLSTTKPHDEAIKWLKTSTDKFSSFQYASLPDSYWVAHCLGSISEIEIRKSEQRNAGWLSAIDAIRRRSKERLALIKNGVSKETKLSWGVNRPPLVKSFRNTHFAWCFPLESWLFLRVLSCL